MKGLILVTILVAVTAVILYFAQHHQGRPPAQDTHTGILKGSVYDCDTADRPNAFCDGARP